MGAQGKKVKEKSLTLLLCVVGLVAVAYGMHRDNNAVFVVGLLFVIGGYLLIRRRLKENLSKKVSQEDHE